MSQNAHGYHRTRPVETKLFHYVHEFSESLQETTYSFKINLVHPFQADLQGRHLKREPTRKPIQRTTTWVWKRGWSMFEHVQCCLAGIIPRVMPHKYVQWSRNCHLQSHETVRTFVCRFSSIASLLIARFYDLFLRKGRTELGDVTPHNIKQLKKLNSVVFPVSYNDKVSSLRT